MSNLASPTTLFTKTFSPLIAGDAPRFTVEQPIAQAKISAAKRGTVTWMGTVELVNDASQEVLASFVADGQVFVRNIQPGSYRWRLIDTGRVEFNVAVNELASAV
jgi:hypothetical protein